MNFQNGYELQRLVAKLRIRGMNTDADKLEENRSTNGLSNEAAQIVRDEQRPAILNEKFPVAQDFHSGLWGWRRINGCIDLRECKFKSRAAASRDRNQSNEKALFNRTGEVCISL
jgi:hypothetical protein